MEERRDKARAKSRTKKTSRQEVADLKGTTSRGNESRDTSDDECDALTKSAASKKSSASKKLDVPLVRIDDGVTEIACYQRMYLGSNLFPSRRLLPEEEKPFTKQLRSSE